MMAGKFSVYSVSDWMILAAIDPIVSMTKLGLSPFFETIVVIHHTPNVQKCRSFFRPSRTVGLAAEFIQGLHLNTQCRTPRGGRVRRNHDAAFLAFKKRKKVEGFLSASAVLDTNKPPNVAGR